MKQIEKTNTNIKKLSFYKRNLPENLIPFSSNEGKELFIKSMNSIYNSMDYNQVFIDSMKYLKNNL